MTFVEGKALGDSVVESLRVMRVDEKFDLLYDEVLCHNMLDMGKPKLLR